MSDEELSAELRAYFAQAKKDYLAERIQPGEFTAATFMEQFEITKGQAEQELRRKLKAGELTARKGIGPNNKACKFYKPVVKSPL